jgi:hypothetical protein
MDYAVGELARAKDTLLPFKNCCSLSQESLSSQIKSVRRTNQPHSLQATHALPQELRQGSPSAPLAARLQVNSALTQPLNFSFLILISRFFGTGLSRALEVIMETSCAPLDAA